MGLVRFCLHVHVLEGLERLEQLSHCTYYREPTVDAVHPRTTKNIFVLCGNRGNGDATPVAPRWFGVKDARELMRSLREHKERVVEMT